MMSITQIAKHFGRTRQAVYISLRKGKFSAKKDFLNRWKIDLDEYDQYHRARFDRKFSKKKDGRLVFDKEKGIYSAVEAADYLNCKRQWVYYRLRSGMLPSKRYKCAWLIHVDDLNKIKEENQRVHNGI